MKVKGRERKYDNNNRKNTATDYCQHEFGTLEKNLEA